MLFGGDDAPPPKKNILIFSSKNASAFLDIFSFSKVFKFTSKIRYRLNRNENQISDLYFSSYGNFCDVITPISDEFFTITRKIKIGEFFLFFSFYSVHTASSMKTGSKLREGEEGLLVVNWEKAVIYYVENTYF